MASRRPRRVLLTVGHARPGYGFGRVLSEVLGALAGRMEAHHFELSRSVAPDPWAPWTTHPSAVPGDYHGLEQLARLLPRLRPDVVLIVKDLWFVPMYLDLARRCSDARVIAYCPVDGELHPIPPLAGLAGLDRLVLPTAFARDALHRALDRLAGTDGAGCAARRPAVEIVPHGTDPARFRPIAPRDDAPARRARARREAMPDLPDPEGAFIVLNANRNQPRKRVDLTIEAFARFAAGKPPSVRLCLHMGRRDEGIDVVAHARARGVADRLLMTGQGDAQPRVDDARLNLIYNACELGLNTSIGEGWGLVAFEHGATGAAQIVPRHSACAELWADSGVLVEAPHPEDGGFFVGRRIDVGAAADALERCYRDPAFLDRMGRAALENAVRRHAGWREVGLRFAELIEGEAASGPPPRRDGRPARRAAPPPGPPRRSGGAARPRRARRAWQVKERRRPCPLPPPTRTSRRRIWRRRPRPSTPMSPRIPPGSSPPTSPAMT